MGERSLVPSVCCSADFSRKPGADLAASCRLGCILLKLTGNGERRCHWTTSIRDAGRFNQLISDQRHLIRLLTTACRNLLLYITIA